MASNLTPFSFKGKEIKPGDYIMSKEYGQRLRVIKCYLGSWTLKPMIDCNLLSWQNNIPNIKQVYVEEVIEHWSRPCVLKSN